MDRIYPPRQNRPIPVVALTIDPVGHGMTGRIPSTSKAVHSLGLQRSQRSRYGVHTLACIHCGATYPVRISIEVIEDK